MMCKKTSSRWSAAKLLLVLPLVAVSLAATATTVYVAKQQDKVNENFVNEQAVGEVFGRVIDAKTKKPIPDAILLINGAGIGTNSDASGRYSLKKLPEGKYTFVASCVGYKSVKKDFEVSSKKSVEVNFEMEEQAVVVDEIVVDKNKKVDQNAQAVAKIQTPAQSTGDEAFIKVESMPTFQGGDLNGYRNWMQSLLQYPKEAKEKGIKGRVIFSFVVEKDGSVSDFQALQSPDKILVNEVVRVFKLTPKWEPGMQNGKAVRVKYTVPIVFTGDDAAVYNRVFSQETPKNSSESNTANKIFPSNSDALVIIDGKEGKIDDVNQEDVESFVVIDKVEGTKIYGEKGKNGVVKIQTKKAAQANKQQPAQEEAFIKVESMPTFQGGDLNGYRNWFQSQLQYPAEAKEKGIKGRVIFSFVVEKDGSVSNFDALQAPDKILVEEVERVFKLTPKWEPGMQNGKAVRVKYTVPIVFAL